MIPPDEGSRILFFSGGTALAPVAAELSRHTRNAVHVITTFDSGGSSAELRRAFDMPAVGPDTLTAMADNGLTALALEANRTIILDKKRFISLAGDLSISVEGLLPL